MTESARQSHAATTKRGPPSSLPAVEMTNMLKTDLNVLVSHTLISHDCTPIPDIKIPW